MSGRIPEEKIEQIRKSIDIVDLISEYVQLKKQGKNFSGLCPIHSEKTPSFSVSPDKQLYHCFGCGAGGNVFSFLMELEGLEFIESVRKLAARSGINLPEVEKKTSSQAQKFEPWIKAHELTAKLYHHVLTQTEQGKEAYRYLQERGFSDEAIVRFQLGFAPDSWEFLSSFLQKRGFNHRDIVDCGLVAERSFDGKLFDRFRGRLMFPLWDKDGRVVGFSGRVLGDGEPKYLNSPESALFNKQELLYAFHYARPKMRKKNEAVLFEGFADVISAYEAGIEYTIAAMGTALSERQAKILRRNVDRVTLCYDSDDAGMNAAYKNAQTLTSAGLNVEIALLPEGYDPDDFIQQVGADRFKNDVLDTSFTFMAFKMRYYRRGKNLQHETERMEYLNQVLDEISHLPRAVERDHYIRQLADEFSLSLDALKQELTQRYKARLKQRQHGESGTEVKRPRTFYASEKRLLPAFQNAERYLLALMLRDRTMAEKVQREIGANFNVDEHQAIAAHLYSFYADHSQPDLDKFITHLPDQRLQKITAELAMMTIDEDLSEQALNDYIQRVLSYPKQLEIDKLQQVQKEAEEANDPLRAAQIAQDIAKMKKELQKQVENES
ncbi:DNA primase [Texcoconibacillus texcoconensis]|uniref:DNA primase n=1 Tax=Texcoconibacillus texcoconensis TaxID=1095777 RepID=A0A840QRD7_9BACI|nr:DNA primase [Texcoconibacillus texcoconensis]MBB5173925.1 DNA primase [Texcoconibacillus texcoconensis]